VHVNTQVGLSFASVLRSVLRQDPDIILVGEIRDGETADIAVKAALTGHLVLSTLHTNDAASAAIRLVDMGVEPYLVASTVRAFIAQRLVRVICPECRETVAAPGGITYRGRGCAHCSQTGYRGRVAVCEMLLLDAEIQEAVLRRASAREIRERAVARGMVTLAADGWQKVAQGTTTAEEILRVTADMDGAAAPQP
jgi:type II secretory ATPase GspE/PulE/Tfp pilus assembly ATPase PilB-like protein